MLSTDALRVILFLAPEADVLARDQKQLNRTFHDQFVV